MWRCSSLLFPSYFLVFFFQAEDGIRDRTVTGVQTCALPISNGCTDLGSFLNQEHVGPAEGRVLRRGAPGRTRAHDEDVDLAVHCFGPIPSGLMRLWEDSIGCPEHGRMRRFRSIAGPKRLRHGAPATGRTAYVFGGVPYLRRSWSWKPARSRSSDTRASAYPSRKTGRLRTAFGPVRSSASRSRTTAVSAFASVPLRSIRSPRKRRSTRTNGAGPRR